MSSKTFDEFLAQKLEQQPELATAWSSSEKQRGVARMLVAARKQAGLTQKQLAEKAGWDQAQVSRMESASNLASIETMQRYLGACGQGLLLGVASATGGHHAHLSEGLLLSELKEMRIAPAELETDQPVASLAMP